ncbi:MAG: C4-type zinc ribbon domain-containing protein [Oryzomonas sp.]|uniref:zinc ribbon domain-containing protein n=1 Tax=Oryzomonas sp. TaxID=2855186 RepID=UPI00284BA2DB|nr:C4-type zinc ribbon domain-containing protein [Oryzomonas sp.]MDR3579166.1 C4-type zinc ribbon domain-containing protein [Oryzomonas sp.]
MKKRLEMLEQLQEIDYQIDNLKTTRNGLTGEMGGIEQALTDARLELAGLESRVVQLEQEKGELEASQAVEQENIRRSETNMKEIKTNKEYQAVGREIAAARKQAAEIEEQTLQKIGLIDELNTAIAALKDTLADLEQNTSQRRDDKQAEIDKIQQDIDKDVARREAITKELPAGIVKRYNALREQRRGQAVAMARDGYCLGCNMNLPPQLYNSLFKGDELISCPHCQRVLILKHQQPQ